MITLVLLPGLDGTGQLFADFAAALAPDIEVIVARYPADQPLGYAGLEALVRAVLPADRDYVLLGESFSGPLAIAIAATAPPGLRGLILCCSFARNPLPALAWLRPFLGVLPVAALPVALPGYFLLGRFATPALRGALAGALAAVAPAVLRQRARAALAIDVSRALAGIRVPVLYLRAREDRVVPASASALVAARVGNTRIVDFAAPHFLLQVLPDAAAATVAGFIRHACPSSRAATVAARPLPGASP